MISFMSEHTVEYALVNSIVKHLSPEFPVIVPMYPWLTREGNSLAKECFRDRRVRLVSVYPRRPKVSNPGDTNILVKFNSFILRKSFVARSVGMPVFAGVPLISDLVSYRIDAYCLWFSLYGDERDNRDLEVFLSTSEEYTDKVGSLEAIRGPIEGTAILEDIKANSNEDNWENWLDTIRFMRNQEEEGRSSLYGPTYKPFYLVLM